MTITKEMKIADIVSEHPEAVPVIMSYGLHCVGCAVAQHETLEQGALGHGMPEKDIDSMVKDINDAVNELKNRPAVALTVLAADKIKEFMQLEGEGEQGVRITAKPEGNAGYTYDMEFEKDPKAGDEVIEHRGIKLFIDKEAFKVVKGTIIDFVEEAEGGGFKFSKPHSCNNPECSDH